METTLKSIQHIYPLSAEATGKLTALFTRIEKPRCETIIRAGKTERYIYFIEKGLARAFVNGENQQINIWFGKEGDVILSFESYIYQRAGYENIELLEDAILYKVSHHDLQALYQSNLEIANWGRKFAEKELIRTEERFICRQFRTAKERYLELINSTPALLQRIPLGQIASYLGVSQVTLSRIRAEVR
ncbi:Crp/Fnr family transcriptional regulator [Pedobacter sp. SYP-B3415]|uniref:Crp/Fnr family transcriptional regulator n=1 Tax=Pedobacter sp. SYP-B3415 TaxID=2496641 RepID=UPI00101CFEC0|nr:Crp/Fnr family transcriptional regulator [Pedobacter sp. SYP-B3415]